MKIIKVPKEYDQRTLELALEAFLEIEKMGYENREEILNSYWLDSDIQDPEEFEDLVRENENQ